MYYILYIVYIYLFLYIYLFIYYILCTFIMYYQTSCTDKSFYH